MESGLYGCFRCHVGESTSRGESRGKRKDEGEGTSKGVISVRWMWGYNLMVQNGKLYILI